MNTLIQEFSEQARNSVTKDKLDAEQWIAEYNRILCELVAERCASICGSQADRSNIRRAFDIPEEPAVKYPGPPLHNSITSQYEREYNLPK